MAKFNTALQSGMSGVAAKSKKAGAALSRKLTLPILAAGAASVKLAKDFEGTFAQMEGLAGVAAGEVEGLKRAVLELGPAVGKGPRELARALYFIRSSGLDGKVALDALTQSAKLSAAGLGETETVADAITSAINAYGKENITAAGAADVLAAAVREGKGEADAMAPALGNILPLASELGVGFDDVAGSIAAMTRIGMNVPSATTSLQAFFSSILKLTPKAEKELKKVGLSAGELRDSLRERGLLSTLELLKKSFDGNVKAMANAFPNIRALRGLLALTGKNADGTREVLDALEKSTGAAGDAFGAVARDEGFKFEQTLAKAEAAGIKLGTALLPVATKVADAVGGLADRFNNLSERQQNIVVFAGVAAAALGPLLTIVGNLAVALKGLSAATVFLATNPAILGLSLLIGGATLAALKLGALGDKTDETKAAFDRAKFAVDGYKNALDRLKQTTNELTDAEFAERAATLGLRRAKVNAKGVIKEYGRGSLEAKEALLAVDQAQLDVSRSTERLTTAQGKNDAARRNHLTGLKDVRNQLENVRAKYAATTKALMQTPKRPGAVQAIADLNEEMRKGQVEKFEGDIRKLMGTATTSGQKAYAAVLAFVQETGRIPTAKAMKVIADTANATDKIQDFQNRATRPLETTLDVNIRTHGSIRAPTGVTEGLAAGGPTIPGRPYLVGEEGPELRVFSRSGRIIPNGALQQGGGGRMRLTIDNWNEGTGWVETIADEGADSRESYRGQLGRMRR